MVRAGRLGKADCSPCSTIRVGMDQVGLAGLAETQVSLAMAAMAHQEPSSLVGLDTGATAVIPGQRALEERAGKLAVEVLAE